MKCNYCWNNIDSVCYVTKCHHVFCQEDAEKHFSNDMVCPACEKTLGIKDVKKVDMFSQAVLEEKTVNAFKFWNTQKELEIKYEEFLKKEVIGKSQQMERDLNEKLIETKSHLQMALKRIQAGEQEQENIKKEYGELQDKYQDKVREKSKLEELYNNLKRKYDQLSRDSRIAAEETTLSSFDSIFGREKSSNTVNSFDLKKETSDVLKSPPFLCGNINSNNAQRLGLFKKSDQTLHSDGRDSSSFLKSSNKFTMLSANNRILFTPLKRVRLNSPLGLPKKNFLENSNNSA